MIATDEQVTARLPPMATPRSPTICDHKGFSFIHEDKMHCGKCGCAEVGKGERAR